MTIELPTNDVAPAIPKSVDRRTLLKAGAWAAPVVLLTTAIPAAAASTNVVPANEFTVTSGALTASGVTATPLSWAGGSILWTPSSESTTTAASTSYTVILSGPAGFTSQTIHSGSTNIAVGGSIDFSAGSYGYAGMPAGQYTIAVVATSEGSAGASSSYTVTYGVSISALTGAATAGSGANTSYRLSFTVANAGPVPVTVAVALGGTGFSSGPTPGNFANLVVPAGGTVTQPVSPATISAATSNQQTGKIATATISGAPSGWTVTNSSKTFKGGNSF